jgi:large subunit ribosomal protein L30
MTTTASKTFFRITLLRSSIGLPLKTRAVLTALGLKKRMQTVYQPITPDAAGMIMRVKELVDVREVQGRLSKGEMREGRRPDPGFWVERRAADARTELTEDR